VANGDSKVTVRIVGDAADLQRDLKESDRALGRFGGNAKLVGAAAAAGFVVAGAAAVEFGTAALAEGDRLGDATARIRLAVGALGDDLVDTADQFSDLGLSAQDMLELEARVIEVGTALGVADDELVRMADDAAATASAIELLGGADAATNIDLIMKAAAGNPKALKELGIFLSEDAIAAQALRDSGKELPSQLTDTDKAAAGLKLVLEALAPKLREVADGAGDAEQKTAALQAKWETFQGVLGQAIDGPLTELLNWLIHGIEGIGMFGTAIDLVGDRVMETVDGPFKAMIDALADILRLTGVINDTPVLPGAGVLSGAPGGGYRAPTPTSGGGKSTGGGTVVNLNVQPRDGADTERAVVNALRDYDRKNGGYR
jgi:hypothetical protein